MQKVHFEKNLAKLYKAGKFLEILSVSDKNSDLLLDSDQSIRILALTYFNLKRYPESAKMLKTLLEAEPNNEELIYNLGVVYQTSGEYQLGVQNFQKQQN